MNESDSPAPTALQRFDPPPEMVYTIESVVRLTQTPRHLIAVYCQHGLITPIAPPERAGWNFDDEAVRTLRRIARLRAEYGVNLRGLRRLTALLEELELLRAEARFLRWR